MGIFDNPFDPSGHAGCPCGRHASQASHDEAAHDDAARNAALPPAAEPVSEAQRFLVLGSFINPDNAKRLAASLGGVEITIVAVGKDGSIFHRVIAGPLDDAGVKALNERLMLQAGVRPWDISEPTGDAPSIGAPTGPAAARDATALLRRQAIASPI